MLNIAIIGGSGYTGGELLRLLVNHPEVQINLVTSVQSAGKPVHEIFPGLKGHIDKIFEPFVPDEAAKKADIFFLALPGGGSAEPVSRLISMGKRVIDLGPDFRLRGSEAYKTWYKFEHPNPSLLSGAVYGLPEIYRREIKPARLIANPGCYPTSIILGLAPLIKSGALIEGQIIIDSKSGVSGVGRSPSLPYHFPEVNEGMEAYKLGNHRHIPEIEQELSLLGEKRVTVSFTPHLVPMSRGILSTIYVKQESAMETDGLRGLYSNFYRDEPFVRIMEGEVLPNPRSVRGANFCDIGVYHDKRTGWTTILSAIDNLGKGASGQAIQNMNIMMGFEESMGLKIPGLFP